jgi:signal peptidase I
MANTLFAGDFILVNLAAYKFSTPQELPILGSPVKPVRLFNTGKPKVNDLIVFKFPVIDYKTSPYLNSNLVKRIVAGPGDTLQIKDKRIFINGSELLLPTTTNRSFEKIKQNGKEDEGIYFVSSKWNSDNYGPLVIPSKGDTIKLTNNNIYRWQGLIAYEYEKKVVRQEGSVITIDDHPAREYVVKKDHYFVMGDNFNNSLDSRYFGFINEDMIIGQVLFVYWSADPSSGIRWGRIFNLM